MAPLTLIETDPQTLQSEPTPTDTTNTTDTLTTATTDAAPATSDMSLCPHQCFGHAIRCDVENGIGICVCAEGFRGVACNRYEHRPTVSVGKCLNSCSGKGSCNPKTGECTCAPGFTGSDCSTISPEYSCVALNSCSGRGRCTEMPETELGYGCVCHDGFEGSDCSTAVKNVCGGCRHGFCEGSKCQCFKGFEGEHCDQYVLESDPCQLSQFCSANGRCLEGTSICVCDHGIRTQNCDTQTSLHLFGCPAKNRTICNNAGMCTKNRTCACNPGYSGETCQHKPCESGCVHGTCQVRPDTSYGCVCSEGWTGDACDHSLNEESDAVCCEDECSKQGVCQNCKCNCFAGFTGDKCESRVSVVEEDVMSDIS
eukprot:c6691_g1_i1.p1 GENE.c6691_g1_i1~~c6691_g1_i1.p1  ORF type:complete len:398 (-),score=103.34 c6691_g1_i1:84-1190(-)